MAAGAVEVNVTTNRSFPCAVFDGVDDTINLPDVPVLDLIENFTIIAKVKSDGTQTAFGGNIVVKRLDAVPQYQLRGNGDNLNFSTFGGASSEYPLPHNEWVTVGGSHEEPGTTVNRLFLNGVQVDSDARLNNATVANNAQIGSLEGANLFKGCIREVMFFNRVLTEAEHLRIHNGESILNGLVAYYKLDTDYKDSVGSNDGTNDGSILSIRDDAIAAAIKADRTTANDKYLMVGMPGGQVVSAVIEEAP